MTMTIGHLSQSKSPSGRPPAARRAMERGNGSTVPVLNSLFPVLRHNVSDVHQRSDQQVDGDPDPTAVRTSACLLKQLLVMMMMLVLLQLPASFQQIRQRERTALSSQQHVLCRKRRKTLLIFRRRPSSTGAVSVPTCLTGCRRCCRLRR